MGRQLTEKIGLTAVVGLSLALSGCPSKTEEAASVVTAKNLYISAGLCNSGPGVVTYTAATASRAVTKWDGNSGKFLDTVIDWNVASGFAASLPQQVFINGSDILILAENATTMTERKIFKVNSSNLGTYQTVIPATASASPATAATHVNRSMKLDAEGMITMNRTASIEKFTPVGAIIPAPTAATSFINPLAATSTCVVAAMLPTGTVTSGGTLTMVSDIALLDPAFGRPSGKTIFSAAGSAIANNRLAATIAEGMTSATAAHCATGVQISSVSHTLSPSLCPAGGCPVTFDTGGASPTAILLIKTPAPATTTGKLIVAYAPSNTAAVAQNNTTNLNHAIVMWDVTETTATAVTFNNPIVLFNNDQILVAPSALAYDESTSSLYVAVGPVPRSGTQTTGNQGYNVEKFTLDIATPNLTRVHDGSFQPFIVGNAQTKCISGMTLGD